MNTTDTPETPLTNAATWISQGGNPVVTVAFAQSLEREINRLKELLWTRPQEGTNGPL